MFKHHRQRDMISCGVHALATALSPWYKVDTVRLAYELRLYKRVLPDGTLPWHMVQVANRYCILCRADKVDKGRTGVFLTKGLDHWVAFKKEARAYMIYNPAWNSPYERESLKESEYRFGFGLREPRPEIGTTGSTLGAVARCMEFIL